MTKVGRAEEEIAANFALVERNCRSRSWRLVLAKGCRFVGGLAFGRVCGCLMNSDFNMGGLNFVPGFEVNFLDGKMWKLFRDL